MMEGNGRNEQNGNLKLSLVENGCMLIMCHLNWF